MLLGGRRFYDAVGPLMGLLISMSVLFPLAMLVRGIVEVTPPTSPLPADFRDLGLYQRHMLHVQLLGR